MFTNKNKIQCSYTSTNILKSHYRQYKFITVKPKDSDILQYLIS